MKMQLFQMGERRLPAYLQDRDRHERSTESGEPVWPRVRGSRPRRHRCATGSCKADCHGSRKAGRGNAPLRSIGFVRKKGQQHFVSDADLAVEALIRRAISDSFPSETILGEEHGLDRADGSFCWVVDPPDGTTNYLRGLPDWAVSIACCEGQDTQCGVIHAPDSGESAWARQGGGSCLDGSPVSASACAAPSHAHVLTGRSNRSFLGCCLAILDALMADGMDCRHTGSAARSLMQVDCGRAEAFYEAHLNPWDAMAGILLVREAGGDVDCPDVETLLRFGGPVLASGPPGMQARLESEVQRVPG